MMPTLQELLTLVPAAGGVFESTCEQPNRSGFLYGGQLLAQALCAAISSSSVAGRRPHALQAAFVQPARCNQPIAYGVVESRDGRSLSSRTVSGRQAGAAVLNCTVSFTGGESGFEHRRGPIESPLPESLPTLSDIARLYGPRVAAHGRGRLSAYAQVDVRPVDPEAHLLIRQGGPECRFWIRAIGPMPDDPAMMPAVIAYLSDYLMVNAALIPHVAEIPNERLFVASINHSVWFHASADPWQWMLYDIVSPWAGHGRALCIGHLHGLDGGMIASVAQEAMVRPLRTSAAGPEGVQQRN